MSGRYTYHFDEGVLAVPGGFEDKSIQLLEWPTGDGPPITLAVSRRPLRGELDEVVKKDLADTRAALRSCVVEEDLTTEVGGARARVLTMRYAKDAFALYHRHLFVALRERLLSLFVSGPAAERASIDELFATATEDFKFRE